MVVTYRDASSVEHTYINLFFDGQVGKALKNMHRIFLCLKIAFVCSENYFTFFQYSCKTQT